MQHKNNKEGDRRSFALGDIAKELKVKKFVLRNWGKEFSLISPDDGSKRLYSDKEIELFVQIKKLIYEDGLSIVEVREKLGLHRPVNQDQTVAATQGARVVSDEQGSESLNKNERLRLVSHVEQIKMQLYALRQMMEKSPLVLSKDDRREQAER